MASVVRLFFPSPKTETALPKTRSKRRHPDDVPTHSPSRVRASLEAMWSTTRVARCGAVAVRPETRARRASKRVAWERPATFSRKSASLPRTLGAGRSGVTTRASSGEDPDREYYDAWSRYPDDPNVPPEITRLLREAGSGEVSMWSSKPPWCQPWTIVLTGASIVAAPTAVLHLKWLSARVVVRVPRHRSEAIQRLRRVRAVVLRQAVMTNARNCERIRTPSKGEQNAKCFRHRSPK